VQEETDGALYGRSAAGVARCRPGVISSKAIGGPSSTTSARWRS